MDRRVQAKPFVRDSARCAAAGVALCSAILCASRSAGACPDPDFNGWYVTPGYSIARSTHGKHGNRKGFVYGTEVGVVHFKDGIWYGGYVDGVYDSPVRAVRASAGPEFGLGILGADLGYAMIAEDGRLSHGLAVRGLVTFGVFAGYIRSVQMSDGRHRFTEWGMLVKFPLRFAPKTDKESEPRRTLLGVSRPPR